MTILAPVAGFAVAVALHGAWNLSALSGLSGFLGVFVAVQVPIFAGCVALAVLARRRGGPDHRAPPRRLRATPGWLTRSEVAMLASLPARREARAWAQRTGGPRAHAGDARTSRSWGPSWPSCGSGWCAGPRPADAQTHELAVLAGLSERRAAFLPAWEEPGPVVRQPADREIDVGEAQPVEHARGGDRLS